MKTKNETTMNDFNATIGNTVLCDGFLIPMTDFVLEQLNEQNSRTKPMRDVFNSLEKYAKFLKQPLKLEMFLPCDEDGNILEEPSNYQLYELGVAPNDEQIKECGAYEKAKEKVLFELNSPVAVETMNYHISRNRNIEYLANFGSIKLTKKSLNAIFG